MKIFAEFDRRRAYIDAIDVSDEIHHAKQAKHAGG
jgi:hypothetical protein